MNEHIKKFMLEAGYAAPELAGRAQQLVELIVRECGEVAYKAYWDNPETVKGIHIKEAIREHFGV